MIGCEKRKGWGPRPKRWEGKPEVDLGKTEELKSTGWGRESNMGEGREKRGPGDCLAWVAGGR